MYHASPPQRDVGRKCVQLRRVLIDSARIVTPMFALIGWACTDPAGPAPSVSVPPSHAPFGDVVIQSPVLGGSAGLAIVVTGLAFGDVQVGSASAAQTVTVTNVSPSSILMSGTGGASSGEFTTSQDCQGVTLATGTSCQMTFTYVPAALGAATATIAGTWNGQAYSVALSGNGVGPKLFIATTGLDFGDVPVGVQSSTLNVAVTNVGLGPVVVDGAGGAPGSPFHAEQDCQGNTLAPGESCQYSYRFTPTAGGEVTGTSVGTINDRPFSITLRGRGIAPRFHFSPAGIEFGEIQVGTTSATRVVTVTNIGPAPTVFDGAGGAPGAPFNAEQDCQGNTIAAGASCQYSFTFTPTTTGVVTGTSSGTINGQSFSIPLSGTGIPVGTSPTAQFRVADTGLDFGDVPVGVKSSTRTVAVTNIGPSPVVVDGAGGAPGSPFHAEQDCQGNTLAPGESCHYYYSLTPNAGGEVTGTSVGTINGQQYSIALRGRGIPPRFRFEPAGIDFGEVQVGTKSAGRVVTVTNIGPAPVVFSGAGGAPGSPFHAEQDCQGNTIAPGESCHYSYTITPTSVGTVTGTSVGTANGQSFSIPLSATGVAPKFLITPVGFDFGNVALFTPSPSQQTIVRNVGVAPVVLSATGGVVNAPFDRTGDCAGVTLGVGASCAMRFTFSPTVLGASSATSAGTWNGQAFSIGLTGTGVTPYTFGGFLGSVPAFPDAMSATAGATMPFNFSLGGDFGLDIFAAGSPASVFVSCGSTNAANATEPTKTPKSEALSYDAGKDVYTYPWKTEKAWAGTCRQFVMTLKDGNAYRVNVSFRPR